MATKCAINVSLRGHRIPFIFGRFDNQPHKNVTYSNRIVFFSTKRPSMGSGNKKTWKIALAGLGVGAIAGTGFAFYSNNVHPKVILNDGSQSQRLVLDKLPNFAPARRYNSPVDHTGLDLVLYQYPTCPFCCKVRAFLDYYGFSYSVVEVNPVLRQQIKWSEYKKVPILLAKVENGYQQLNDSSVIISALTSYLNDQNQKLLDVLNYYPAVSYSDDDGKPKMEVLNRYFVMFQGAAISEKTSEALAEERKWRKWADEVLVHTLSPNVYRTFGESLQSFRWFSELGEWERLFPVWESYLIVYVGALAMWMIGKRLKKRHNLKDDVRQSLYDECNIWVRQLKKKGTRFMGGDSPNLADLADSILMREVSGKHINVNKFIDNIPTPAAVFAAIP
ncbi:hypothetical protein J437_LFUL007664 [Ladona fulva]|uniref:Prostaglandin E synthase 2 n=1 Tax=Ladona fulva TaxID=123851 RepID=A0A8K0P2S3_LADFU|nr:hypothetical protein J437_LFUL007664 [Ladona fulva]